MKRIALSLCLMVGAALVFMPVHRADAVDFAVTATIPTATGVVITATEVESGTDVFGSTVTEFNFNPMVLNPGLGIFLPDHYYAVDVGVVGGAGTTDVNVKYTEGTKPAGQTNGLGFKSVVTFVAITGGPAPVDQVQTPLAGHPKKLLKSLPIGGESILGTELGGGFFRAFFGIFPGDDPAIIADSGEVFTTSDRPGNYTGTITITAVVS